MCCEHEVVIAVDDSSHLTPCLFGLWTATQSRHVLASCDPLTVSVGAHPPWSCQITRAMAPRLSRPHATISIAHAAYHTMRGRRLSRGMSLRHVTPLRCQLVHIPHGHVKSLAQWHRGYPGHMQLSASPMPHITQCMTNIRQCKSM